MPEPAHTKRTKATMESQLAFTARVLKGLHKSIDEQMDLARDIEVQHAIALLESGKAKLIDHDDMMRLAKKRIG